MRKKSGSVLSVILIVVIAVIAVKYFRPNESWNDTSRNSVLSDEDIEKLEMDPNAEELVKQFEEEVRLQVEPEHIVSSGRMIETELLGYKVNSWEITKEDPGYQLPNGLNLEESRGIVQDENGKIVNEYSFFIVNMEVENFSDLEVVSHIWGLRLKIAGTTYSSGEVEYLGEENPRPCGHDYYKEIFQPGEVKEMPLIWIVPDECLKGTQAYIEINPSGIANGDKGKKSVIRWIALK